MTETSKNVQVNGILEDKQLTCVVACIMIRASIQALVFGGKKEERTSVTDLVYDAVVRGLSKKYPTFGGEKYISYVTGLEP